MQSVCCATATQVCCSRDMLRVYEQGRRCLIDGDYTTAFELLCVANKNDVFGSAYTLGKMTQHGYGCEKNKDDAYTYFLQSLRRGHSVAGYEVAMTLHNDERSEKTYAQDERVFELFTAAAAGTERCLPVLHAHHMLGVCRMHGFGVVQDEAIAARHFLRHRALCFDRAQIMKNALISCRDSSLCLGVMHLRGTGVVLCRKTAESYFEDAKKGGISCTSIRALLDISMDTDFHRVSG